MFTKFFFPHQVKEQQTKDNSDSDDDDENASLPNGGLTAGEQSVTETMSLLSNSTKNRELSGKLKELEKILMKKLSNNWVSVRKAFLDMDSDYDGKITAEDFAKLVGGTVGFDFNILKMLVRMKNAGKKPEINYTEFSKWFG